MMCDFYISVSSIERTCTIAAEVSPSLKLGDVLILTGGLAAGKTSFVKGLASALGSDNAVTSPTYAIANFYDISLGKLLHIDAYRLSGLPEFIDLGLEDFLADSITVVEWGDLIAEAFAEYLTIQFTRTDAEETHRQLTFSHVGERWRLEVASLKDRLSRLQ
jgi:tRNA threonylcarbamoyladenosine biosynthesis protein TsaE